MSIKLNSFLHTYSSYGDLQRRNQTPNVCSSKFNCPQFHRKTFRSDFKRIASPISASGCLPLIVFSLMGHPKPQSSPTPPAGQTSERIYSTSKLSSACQGRLTARLLGELCTICKHLYFTSISRKNLVFYSYARLSLISRNVPSIF